MKTHLKAVFVIKKLSVSNFVQTVFELKGTSYVILLDGQNPAYG